jgi:hypothetical protein
MGLLNLQSLEFEDLQDGTQSDDGKGIEILVQDS